MHSGKLVAPVVRNVAGSGNEREQLQVFEQKTLLELL